MPTLGHIQFVERHRELIREPILIVGSKIYDYDQANLQEYLKKWGFSKITGADISEGRGVDVKLDITDAVSPFWARHENHFQTVFCMEILTHVARPFEAAENIRRVTAEGGMLFLAESAARKISKMPSDFWRFTLEGLEAVFTGFEFDDARTAQFLTRAKSGVRLMPCAGKLPEVMAGERHPDESAAGFWLRRIHRKLFSKGVFSLSRLLPETTICAAARKK